MTDDLHALSGAYVMNALDPEERARFEAHLATSLATAEEVASLRETVALLGAAATETPPAGLRAAVLDRVDRTRQDRPVVDLQPRTMGRRADDRRSDRSWALRLAVGAAAAAVLISTGLGLRVASLSGQLDEVARTSSQIAAVVSADDARQSRAEFPAGGALTSVVSDSHGVGIAVAHDLGLIDADQMYALWGISSGVPVPIGELVDGQPLTLAAADFDALGVTIEPRGPLTTPTSAVIATLPA